MVPRMGRRHGRAAATAGRLAKPGSVWDDLLIFSVFVSTLLAPRAKRRVEAPGGLDMETDLAPDERLMALVADDEPGPMVVLVRRYAGPLLTFIPRMIGDRHRAEEVFQEGFLAVWSRRRTYEYPRPFRCWLFGIAANKYRAELRWRRSRPARFVPTEEVPLAAADPPPGDAVIAEETATLVAAAVAALPVAQRTTLVLRVWNGLSYREIATVLGRAEATVRANMFHALAAVRKYLEPRLG